MLRQFVRVYRRAALGQVGRRGAQHHARARQRAADQAGVGQARDADHEVVALLHQIDHPVRQHDVQADLRVLRREAAPQRGQVQRAEGLRRADAQTALGLHGAGRHLGLGLLHGLQHLLATLVISLALTGERQPARGALQQPRAQVRLQVADLTRHGGLGEGRCIHRADEAAGLDHGREGFHRLQDVHSLDFRNKLRWLTMFISLIDVNTVDAIPFKGPDL